MFTSLKALKWSYKLGVDQERQRIASYLQMQAHGARVSRNAFDGMMRDEAEKKRPNKGKLSQLDFEKAVQARVEMIIEDIFQSNGEWTPGSSIMFPDEGGKK